MYVTEADLTRQAGQALKDAIQSGELEAGDALTRARQMGRLVRMQREKAREAGLLLTPRQGADRDAGRTLQIGDRARYIGPTRLEDTPRGSSSREHGQEGTVTAISGVTLTFTPDDASTALVVRLNGPSYNLLERLP